MGNLPNGWTDYHQIWHTCADSSGNRHRLKTISSNRPKGGTWGVLGGQKCKSLENLPNTWTDWPQIWYTSADSSRNGHRLKTISPSIHQGAFWWVLGVTHSTKVRKMYQEAVPIGTKFVTSLRIHLGMDIPVG